MPNPSKGRFVSSRILQQPLNDTFYSPSLKATFDLGWSQLTSTTTYLTRTDSQGYDYTLVLPPAFGWSLATLSAADAEPVIVGTNQNNFTPVTRPPTASDP